MVFKRRQKKSLWIQVKNFFWPSMGWKRSFSYIKHRVIRLQASNYAVAAGLAFGASISWAPTLGFHIIQACLLCFIFRANYLAALLGTIIGNPWTFPLMFFVSYQLGFFVIDLAGYKELLPTGDIDFSLSGIADAPWAILGPMLVGGYMMTALTFPLFYGAFYVMVRSARATRQKILDRKQ